ncbi:MAG: hypothetical protein MUE57_08360, partial [Syntrophales bacterium]|nr:hypothetical protein [Syntrophales bacterium]
MFRVLDDESTIRRCQRQFMRALRPCVTGRIAVKIGHPGESFRARVFWAEGPGLWYHTGAVAGERYLNAFGIGRPSAGSAVSSTIEINVPMRSLDRKIGGAFARDDGGRVFLVHRGKIGGRRGVGKFLFESHYRGVWSEVEDGDARSTVVVIGELQSRRFVRQLAQFVRKVEAVKDLEPGDESQARISFDDDRFREECIGARYGAERRDYAAECDRDLCVSDLACRLRDLGVRVGSDPSGELTVRDPAGRIAAVIEVAAGTAAHLLEQAVGRLMLRSAKLQREPRRFLAVPGGAGSACGNELAGLGIRVVPWRWDEGNAVFDGLAGHLDEMGDRKTRG